MMMLRGRSKSALITFIIALIIVGTQLFLLDDTSTDSVVRSELTDDPELARIRLIESLSLTCNNCSQLFSNTSTNGTNSSLVSAVEIFLRERVHKLNNEQTIHNLDRFDLRADGDGAVVIVIQVHNRPEYLRQLVDSLRTSQHISEVLLIFSHDFYSQELNNIVTSIDFCPVMQIFYPFSMQLYPHEFPGEDPRDCPRNANKEQALAMKCLNAETPDRYGHYREVSFSQIKHHWFWKINHVFDYLTITRFYNGLVLLLEEDHYVAPDFISVLRQMYRLKHRVCSQCSIFTLGTYDKAPSYGDLAAKVDVLSWVSAKHNMGMAFDRKVWEQIKACAQAFCRFDDYNWDWSLQFAGVSCLPSKLRTMVVKSPRVFHVGECGGIHSKQHDKCESPAGKISSITNMLQNQKQSLFPAAMTVNAFPYSPDRLPKANGGWGDIRDHEHCLLLTTNATHL